MPLPISSSCEILAFRDGLRQSFLVVSAHRRADGIRRTEVDNQHVNRTVGLRLEDEFAVKFQRCTKQHREHDRFGEQLRHRLRIIMTVQNVIERRS